VTYNSNPVIEKKFDSPASTMILTIKFQINQNLNSYSRIILVFPGYYIPKLSREDNLYCSIGKAEPLSYIQCFVTEDRYLEIRYVPMDLVTGDHVILEI
jgi:hypothetical protein